MRRARVGLVLTDPLIQPIDSSKRVMSPLTDTIQPRCKKSGAETAPEDVPKEEDENRERTLPAFTLNLCKCDAGSGFDRYVNSSAEPYAKRPVSNRAAP